MSRLIDADALAEDLLYDAELCATALDSGEITDHKELARLQFEKDCKQNCVYYISECPTVDAVPVPVRCKNCKFNYGLSAGHGFSSEDIVCSYWDSDGLDENDYCSHGEQFVKECD